MEKIAEIRKQQKSKFVFFVIKNIDFGKIQRIANELKGNNVKSGKKIIKYREKLIWNKYIVEFYVTTTILNFISVAGDGVLRVNGGLSSVVSGRV